MKFMFFNFILLLSLCGSTYCDGFFTIVGPRFIRFKGKYQVSVASQGYETPQILEVAIRSSKKEGDIFEIAKNVTLDNGKAQKIEFDLKDQPEGDYNLEARTLSGEAFNKSRRLDMNTKKHSVFVQTDKSIYKPADKVQFRVLVLDADLKPLKKSKVQVHITDGAQNRVKQFEESFLTKGVFQNELQLSDLPVLGNWKIHVKLNGEEESTKEFEVAEYTLPKFEVTIEANKDANFKDGKIVATVKAKYTFGKTAKGNATVTAEVEDYRWWYRRSESYEGPAKVSKSVEIDGKKPVEFDIENELKIKEKNRERTVKLFATFKEELTGREQNATTKVTIHRMPYKMELKKTSTNIKPGLPFSVSAIVKKHEKDAPVTDTKNPMNFTIIYYYDTLRTCEKRRYEFQSYENPEADESNSTTVETTTYVEPVTITFPIETYDCREEHSYSKETLVPIINGFAKIDIEIPSNTTHIRVVAKYQEIEQTLYISQDESESNQFIHIKSATAKPQLSEKILIDVLATHELSKLTYHVIAKGHIAATETLTIPNVKKYQIEIKPNLDMVPKANVIVYYITSDGEIISDTLSLEFGNELKNFININFSKKEAKPGEQVELSVKTNPESFVGLLGVDQSVLILKKGNDIEQSVVFDDVMQYGNIDKYNYVYYSNYDFTYRRDFSESDSIVITNAKKPYSRPYIERYNPDATYPLVIGPVVYYDSDRMSDHVSNRVLYHKVQSAVPAMASGYSPSVPAARPVEIRKDFPETWIFDSFDFNSSTSNIVLSKKVPDTITSWIITGFSVDPKTGLGLTREPSKFTVFQPFFVTTNLPYSIKRGEVVSIPVIVFNYLEDDQTAEVTLFNTEGEFEFVDVVESKGKRPKREVETQKVKKIEVKSQSGVTIPFMIRPLKVGHITIKVVATSAVAGDGVERELRVEPEGVTKFLNKAVFIDLRTDSEFKTKFEIDVPASAVPDSTRIEASAVGDILGPSIENLDKLIKLPYGCGEQNMLNFVPNIVVLDYLTNVGKLTPEIGQKAKKFMESGYQRELTYKHDDGSYSAFGKSDKSGSTWLTAFVAKSFRQASKYIMIEEEIIKQALSFLASVQALNGSFPEVGHVSHKDMQGGSSSGIALTAYTLITFLENQDPSRKYQNTIDKALYYIKSNFDSLDDTYSLAIATYALQLANDNLKDSALQKLISKADSKGGLMYWEKAVPKSDEKNLRYYKPNSVNVEMSAYAMQAILAAGRDTDAVPIMKWLVTQRNENGGFESTQDTVVGLQALSKLASKIYVPNSKIDITLKHESDGLATLNVNPSNALVLQKQELSPAARNFEVSAVGRGFTILQVAYRYNLNTKGDWPRFTLEPVVSANSNKEFLELKVCTSYVADEDSDTSNMAVMEVSFPSGFTFDSDSLSELMTTENVKKVESKDGDTVVVVYFDDVGAKKLCPVFKAYRTSSVAKHKPAPIKVYDYYDNSQRASGFYNPPEISLCDICDGAEECKKDCEEPEINVV